MEYSAATNDETLARLTREWHELTLTDFMFVMKAHDINRAHDAIELIKDAAFRKGKASRR